jgi:hypothetical protein
MRTLPYALAALLVAGSGAALLSADEPPAPAPQPAPDAKASDADVLRWIGELTSDDFRTREAASKHLEAAGEGARAALETAAKNSDSLEVRWRAEQILLKLEAPGARPLGKPGEQPRSDAERERLRELWGADTAEAMREAMERLFRDFGRPGGAFTPFGLPGGDDPFAAFAPALRSGDLTLALPFLGAGPVRLTVRAKDGTNTTHTGKSLDEILAAHPELKEAPGMADLQKQLAERLKRAEAFRLPMAVTPGGSVRFQTNGVEAVQDANGAVVRITEPGPDGKDVTTEYKGATLEEIKEKNPQIAKHLKGMPAFRVQIGPRIFNGPREGGLAPLPPPSAQPVPARPEGFTFGLALAPVEPALALHLRLENGRGVLVDYVEPGSQAAQMGLERYDVIETIDGAPVLAWEQARQVLRAAAKDKAPLSLGIIRTGKKQTLSR